MFNTHTQYLIDNFIDNHPVFLISLILVVFVGLFTTLAAALSQVSMWLCGVIS